MKAKNIQIGKLYDVDDVRAGKFRMMVDRVSEMDGNDPRGWIYGEVVSGMRDAIHPEARCYPGDPVTVRGCLATLKKVRERKINL